jgi:hypothetical protein
LKSLKTVNFCIFGIDISKESSQTPLVLFFWRSTPKPFLVNAALRLYPAYITMLLQVILVLVSAASLAASQNPFPLQPNANFVTDKIAPLSFVNYTFTPFHSDSAKTNVVIQVLSGSVFAFASINQAPTFIDNNWRNVDNQGYINWEVFHYPQDVRRGGNSDLG